MLNPARSAGGMRGGPSRRRVVLGALACSLGAGPLRAWAAAAAAGGNGAAIVASEVPVYRTRLPPPATLHYGMRRGIWSGTGELAWRPAAGRYEARLDAEVAGLQVLTEVSTGVLDANGIAPQRYTDKRLRRAPTAASFERDTGRITYSGQNTVHPLPAGAQDRVSWMIQLPAIVNGEPSRASAGGTVALFVSGARGDAQAWTFRCHGVEPVSTPLGVVRAVKFTREPRRPGDKLAEIWLSPAHHHLPVRARFVEKDDDEVFELLLRDIRWP